MEVTGKVFVKYVYTLRIQMFDSDENRIQSLEHPSSEGI